MRGQWKKKTKLLKELSQLPQSSELLENKMLEEHYARIKAAPVAKEKNSRR